LEPQKVNKQILSALTGNSVAHYWQEKHPTAQRRHSGEKAKDLTTRRPESYKKKRKKPEKLEVFTSVHTPSASQQRRQWPLMGTSEKKQPDANLNKRLGKKKRLQG